MLMCSYFYFGAFNLGVGGENGLLLGLGKKNDRHVRVKTYLRALSLLGERRQV